MWVISSVTLRAKGWTGSWDRDRELEDDLENSKKRGREKGNTPKAVKKASHISRLSMAGGQNKLAAPGKVSLLNK